MPVTTLELFTSAVQTSTGARVWTDVNNVLAEAGQAQTTYTATDGQFSEYIEASLPLAGAQIPPFSKIDFIRIEVSTYGNTAASTNYVIRNVAILPGFTSAGNTSLNEGSPQTEVFEGNLSYWNLTEAQAQQFVSGVNPLHLRHEKTGTGTGGQSYVVWVKCQITYSKKQIPAPLLF